MSKEPITAPFDSSSSSEEFWELILFVIGRDMKMQKYFSQVERICEQYLAGRYRLQVIDILEKPEQAQAFDIIAIPTLIRQQPKPVKKILGDLAQTEKVLSALDLTNDMI